MQFEEYSTKPINILFFKRFKVIKEKERLKNCHGPEPKETW